MHLTFALRRFRCLSALALLALSASFALGACGGSSPPPEAPPPPLDEPSTPPPAADRTAQASSAKVQQGIDAIKAQDFATAKARLTEARAEAPKDPQAAFYLGVALEGL